MLCFTIYSYQLSRFWWLQITVLADGGDWLELEKFSKSKKSPIGYEVIYINSHFLFYLISYTFKKQLCLFFKKY